MKKLLNVTFLIFLLATSCQPTSQNTTKSTQNQDIPFLWENANVYFMLTDRFNNGNTANDVNFDRSEKTGYLRNFMGGDIKGITKKIEDGYFDKLGINALWFTPVVEQVHGYVDEGTGKTYGYHGYWAKDWTSLDPNFGTEEDLTELIETAHKHGIRILLDVVINHTGPVTDKDPVWSDGWVITDPACTYQGFESTVSCTLVKNLPDIKTNATQEVEISETLREKWAKEGRLEKELKELEEFFARTGNPKTPRYYIIKWLTDYIRKYGVDGFRVDTVKHTEVSVWSDLRKEADIAFAEWKKANPDKVMDKNDFYMVGEVYNYGIQSGKDFNYGDTTVNYFDNGGFNSLINFSFKGDANKSYEEIFSSYDLMNKQALKDNHVLNYISSHDDGGPFDKERKRPIEAGTKLMLTSGAVQVYYGDETNRPLIIEGTEGDATLRSFMNWEDIKQNTVRNGFATQDVLTHWQKLGQFRKNHPAVGMGAHKMISKKPYLFTRTYAQDNWEDSVLVGLDLPKGKKELTVQGVFKDGTTIKDAYSNQSVKVEGGKVIIDSSFDIVLLEAL